MYSMNVVIPVCFCSPLTFILYNQGRFWRNSGPAALHDYCTLYVMPICSLFLEQLPLAPLSTLCHTYRQNCYTSDVNLCLFSMSMYIPSQNNLKSGDLPAE